ncbi:MAG: 1-acyl-sn-glycerol-3-phosphate acyltransferase [Candidatus Gastranaerophilales bacterium]|nr:1-acyl-sn-glycerol-3-phosphate acyltransferase [Candidatus Gastranaerophilales bacterium]
MIEIIRNCILAAMFVIFGFGALVIRYCIFPFKKTIIEKYETLQKSWQFFLWLMQKTKLIRLDIQNLEKIKNIKNSIIVSTHPSFIDIVILMSIIPHSTCFVAAKLARNPFLRGIVNLLFILDVESIDEWLNKTCEKADMGFNIIIFPMGSRHRKNETPKIRRGTALIAEKTKQDIVLLHMETSFDFLQIGQPFYEAGKETVLYKLDYLGEINTKEYLEEYEDRVTFKTKLIKKITEILYQHKN